MPRVIRRARTRDALLLGLGIAILANSRPTRIASFHPRGGLLPLVVAGKTKSPATLRMRIVCVFAPLGVVLLLTVGFMGYYNWRLTGKLSLPVCLEHADLSNHGLFLWDRQKEPLEYHNQQFEDFYNGWEREDYRTRAGRSKSFPVKN